MIRFILTYFFGEIIITIYESRSFVNLGGITELAGQQANENTH